MDEILRVIAISLSVVFGYAFMHFVPKWLPFLKFDVGHWLSRRRRANTRRSSGNQKR